MSCEGCEPANPGQPPAMRAGPNTGPPIWEKQSHQAAKDLAKAVDGAVSMDATDMSMRLNADAFKNTDPATIELMNRVRSLHIEVAAVVAVFLRRGIISDKELQESRFAVNQAVEQQFRQQLSQLGRLLGQRPPNAPAPVPTKASNNPRRSPQ